MEELRRPILETLCYADIFDYPLKIEEIYRYLINHEFKRIKNEFKLIGSALEKLARERKVGERDGYYFLAGRGEIVGSREKRKVWSLPKIRKAEKITNLLKIIPTVKLVGISGALAMENSDENDDIDLFIVTSAGRLWLTRFLVTVLVELRGERRRPGISLANSSTSVSFKDKICLNMFVDEAHLAVPEEERNLFTAHEVAQMRKAWDKDGTYQKFLWENRWVREYLPNALNNQINTNKQISKSISNKQISNKKKLFHCFIVRLLHCLEKVLMNLQLKYMEKRRTIEKIESGRILFHPDDKTKWVVANLKLRTQNLKL
jgi:hypothetical protein